MICDNCGGETRWLFYCPQCDSILSIVLTLILAAGALWLGWILL
jgi:hypothetical protein